MSDFWDSLAGRLSRAGRFDAGLFWGLVALGITGTVMIYSATRAALENAGYDPHFYLIRQGTFVAIGIVLMYVMSRVDYRRLEIVATPSYIASLIALVGVFVLGKSALGAQRWYDLKFVQVQPSEFTVLVIIVAFATYCQRRPEGLTMRDVARLLLMTIVPVALIFKQPDLGTTIVIVLCVGAMMVIAGVPPRFLYTLTVLGTVGLVAGASFNILKRYQVDRFVSFLNQNSTDPALQTLVYEVNNAKSAIGSGGWHGAGLFQGLQTVLGYVPEQRTDFIFTAIGEQLGFLGSLVVVALLAWVAFRMYRIARQSKDTMGRLMGVGIFIFFAFSCFENIGMTMGIMPVTGIPLPLLSYGGSAALVFYTAGGLLLSVSRRLSN